MKDTMYGYIPYYSIGCYTYAGPEFPKPFYTIHEAIAFMLDYNHEAARLVPDMSWIGVDFVETDEDGGVNRVIEEIYKPRARFWFDDDDEIVVEWEPEL
jgi:hypothetical protein